VTATRRGVVLIIDFSGQDYKSRVSSDATKK
jgi:hypothetical protein